MVVGGLFAATRSIGTPFTEHRVVIAGAGSSGHGIYTLIAQAMEAAGLSIAEAKSRIFVLDSRGLVTAVRSTRSGVKRDLATPAAVVAEWDATENPYSLLGVVSNVQPTVLIGVSGTAGLFAEDLITAMGRTSERPIVMALSNPTSHTEVTPANAIRWTDGRAIVATGSPFSPVEHNGEIHRIGQANNVFAFPGVGLGVITVRAREVTDGMFLAAARALADMTGPELVARGQIYPDISDVREVSRAVAIAVARQAIEEGAAGPLDDLESKIDEEMWTAEYLPYRPVGMGALT